MSRDPDTGTELQPRPAPAVPARREPRQRGGGLSGLIGAIAEAWDELRIHRTRVLLSLVGVGVAVCALASVVGIGAVAQQAQIEQMERGSGRPATLSLGQPYDPVTGEAGDPAVMREAFETAVERYSIRHAGAVVWGSTLVQFRDGATMADTRAVDVDYAVMHRQQLAQGRWFTERDELRLAPAIVINHDMYQRMGSPDLATHPTLTLLGERGTVAVVIGVTPQEPWSSQQYFILNSAYAQLIGPEQAAMSFPSYELWVPPELADELTERIRRDVAAAFGEGWEVWVERSDYLAWGVGDPLEPVRLVLVGISVLILLLGALGLVNISLVTVRQRIREIGIRRAFGATAGRIFFAVMMESVVATVVAGFAGVLAAVLIVQNPWLQSLLAPGLSDVPPFPVEAAVIGLLASAAVGALAGLLPALVAVRVKVIDAIRY